MRLVLTHGCWDILTMGHLEHFEEAKRYGDLLIVSVSEDSVVSRKGANRPIRNQDDRLRMLRSLRVVDHAFLCQSWDATAAILKVRPRWFVQGVDYAASGPTIGEREACEAVGAEWTHTLYPKGESTTLLLERIRKCASS